MGFRSDIFRTRSSRDICIGEPSSSHMYRRDKLDVSALRNVFPFTRFRSSFPSLRRREDGTNYRKIARQVSTPDSAPAGLGSPQGGIGGLQQQHQQQTQQSLHQPDPMQQTKDNLNPAANQQTGALRNGNPPPPVVSMNCLNYTNNDRSLRHVLSFIIINTCDENSKHIMYAKCAPKTPI
ncbi:hypothetical protein ALC60_09972 [Trachymyrmex zeteki]|uniref:Uncharacterized protein n=1 Tax=Mycetomoellerius zeteki TaxID=64791 RepID=A0A151WSN6_9HYME|nr:hypothetical protein ALC60_09972 [Trachymyrmex zeteki]